ncbi:ABC multidrug transporter SitT [Tothia fuscella]|uniref:ABC multidrug transporter SitT n=1 Tax=Tothia fuscella TaxID=1048955 RepID=A0A9P4TVY1_9PEZI|nr:ABC multidrug transporter SitT [Tothia fuscella]
MSGPVLEEESNQGSKQNALKTKPPLENTVGPQGQDDPKRIAIVESASGDSNDRGSKDEREAAKVPWYKGFGAYFRLLLAADPTPLDITLLVVGSISAIASGVPIPLLGILFGQLIDDFNQVSCESTTAPTRSDASYQREVNHQVLLIFILGIAQFITMYTHLSCWSLQGARLAQRLREKYLRSLLRQESSFFDDLPAGEVSSRLNGDIQSIRAGTSEKVGIVISSASFFVTAYIIAFIKQAKLAGMLASLVPAYFLMSFVGSHYIEKYSSRMSDHVASAAAVASEGLSNIPLVQAFGAGSRLETKFSRDLQKAKKEGIKKAIATGIQTGLLYFIAYAANALAFWQGSRSIADAVENNSVGVTVGSTYTVIFILVDSTLIFSQVAPFLQIFGAATGTFRKLQKDMDHVAPFDGTSDSVGERPIIEGGIEVRDVSFTYPSRPEKPVLQNINLSFPAGKYSAIVGLSGSGKSTIAGLTTRLYDPTSGGIFIDGHNLHHVNVRHLRSHISLVQQEPTMLDRSIFENIALGLVNSPLDTHASLKDVLLGPDIATFAESLRSQSYHNLETTAQAHGAHVVQITKLVQQAAVLADADGFIQGLQHGYGTLAGTSGRLLSGGQKQRIALARALVRDPKILILDEATASLDSHSEQRIQAAIEQIANGRTVISIAHRLSTVKNADNIVVMRDGRVLEQGSHSELMATNGAYADLINLQALNSNPTDDGSKRNSIHSKGMSDTQFSTSTVSFQDEKTGLHGTNAEAAEIADAEDDPDVVPSARSLSSIVKGLSPMIRRDIPLILLALLGSIMVGGAFSAEAVIFGNTVGNLNPCQGESHIRFSGRFFGLMFFVLAIIEFFANLVSWSGFGFVAEKLLYSVRVLSFRSLFEQNLEWHQAEDRTPTGLLALITRDGDALGGLSGSVLGTIFSIVVNLIAAIILTHIIAWKIALVCLSIVPLLLTAGMMEIRVLTQFETKHQEAYSKSVGIAVESINCHKTIASFSLEHEAMATYQRALQKPKKETTFMALHASLWLTMIYFIGTMSYALAFWWGSKQILNGTYTQTQFLIVVMSLLVSAALWGQMFALAPELTNARASVARILNLLDTGSTKKLSDVDSAISTLEHWEVKDIEAVAEPKSEARPTGGVSITFRDVSFNYPGRASAPVLQNLNLTIRPGQFCAFVGPSGAGKSTIIFLIEKLYVPTSGTVEINGLDITRRKDVSFRDNIALVPQDCSLFEGTIRFNISLGARPDHEATDAEIEEAARLANIHDTIMSMPQGYSTPCGPNGSLLSGGQKQRLAIARALVRKPQLLILDESTSALDAESEKLLQDGLDKAARGITVVAIAHRLHTIKKADVIFLIEEGRCVDRGTHRELFERSERYRENAMHQMFDAGA